MTKLNQVIAIEKGVKARAHSLISELFKTIQKPVLFDGATRVYRKKDEDGEDLPAERKVIQFRVQDILGSVRMSVGHLMDVTAQKEIANCSAQASVRIDGAAVLPPLPVTTLLFLEKQLTDLRTFAAALPVLDISEAWKRDESAGVWRTETAATTRTKKVQKPLVLYPATPEHPAQTQIVTEDVIAGYWETVKQSAAIPATEKEKIIARIDKLLVAVKEAREEANSIDANTRPQLGALVFNYLLDGTVVAE